MCASPPGGATHQIRGEQAPGRCAYLKQELPQGHKGGPVIWFGSPALQHDVINVLRAVFGLREAFTFFINLVQDLRDLITCLHYLGVTWTEALLQVYLAPVEAQPRLLAVCEHLPQGNSKHPCVCGVGKRPGLQTLWSAPKTAQKQEKVDA